MSTTIDKSNNEFWLTKAQFESRYNASTLVVGAIYHITDEKLTIVYTGTTAPTTSTAGEIGDMYVNTTSNDIYICVASGSTYTWEQLASTSDISGKANLSGGNTFTGQQNFSNTSYNYNSGAIGGFKQASAGTIPDLLTELRYTNGQGGSVSIGTAYTLDGVTISSGWYNYLYIPHRVGGASGSANGDNTDYGMLWLCGMTVNTRLYSIRYASGSIANLKEYADLNGTQTFTRTASSKTNQFIVNTTDNDTDIAICCDTTSPQTKSVMGKGYVWTQNNNGNTYSQFKPEGIYYGNDTAGYERTIKFPTTTGTDEQTFLTNANFSLNGTTLTITI